MDTDLKPISCLHAAGEIVGGCFYFSYLSGTGLTTGAVIGRISGHWQAQAARRLPTAQQDVKRAAGAR